MKEKSPYGKKKISVNKIGSVMEYLLDYNRIFWLRMCKNSEVILGETGRIIGPFPNWKIYKIICDILVFEQVESQKMEDAKAAIKDRPLFITPEPAAKFVPPGN